MVMSGPAYIFGPAGIYISVMHVRSQEDLLRLFGEAGGDTMAETDQGPTQAAHVQEGAFQQSGCATESSGWTSQDLR